jgi:DNA (cytosine-5)-methyltransferase 1
MILIVAENEQLLNEAAKIQTLRPKTVFETIGDLPIPPIGKSEVMEDPLHFARNHSALNIERLRHIPKDGGSRDSLPHHLQQW